ncbi:MAG TPA: DNA replication and repair protein RecF [bacterium]|nr:DNA replication and repair protein RecF [bacterium]HOL46567.1 DNA replication and repair protein RecF [bacterium]HPQ17862.1 DNA replication and repair protein RecF [bacterium]
MIIKKLFLKNFRIYSEKEFFFDKKINVIYGPNGIGKTNIIEAIYLCAFSKSFKNIKENDLINFSSDFFLINLFYDDAFIEHNIKVTYTKYLGKKIFYDNEVISSLSDLLGKIYIILFEPDNINIVKDAPEYKRKFIDTYISLYDREYFCSLKKYKKILKTRNFFLKEKKINDKLFNIYTKKFINLAKEIILKRIEFINRFNSILHKIFSENLLITFNYVNYKNITEKEEVEYVLNELSSNYMNEEIKLGYTCFGPHIDDLKIQINKRDARFFASYGEQKFAAIILKLALFYFYKNYFNLLPILLLDDVFSELDKKKKEYIINILNNCSQVILTSTDEFNFDANYINL